MKNVSDFIRKRGFPLILIIIGLVMAIVAIQVITGVPGFTTFVIGALVLITGLLTIVY